MSNSNNLYHVYEKNTIHQFEGLLRFAGGLSWESQIRLRRQEDPLAKLYHVNLVKGDSPALLHYLNLTSLPFIKEGREIPPLRDLWETPTLVDGLVWRPTYGTGNLRPKYLVLGDAPGVGDGALPRDDFDRVFVYGVSSHLLRKALIHMGIYYQTYFTNLLKLSTAKNAPSTKAQQQAHRFLLEQEIDFLQPRRIILLGNHVAQSTIDVTCIQQHHPIRVYHPSYAVRNHWSPDEYSEHLESIF